MTYKWHKNAADLHHKQQLQNYAYQNKYNIMDYWNAHWNDTLQGGDTRRKKNYLWANLQRIVEKRGRTGKKGVKR